MTKKSTARIAVLGATGQVGREIIQVLAETGVPVGNVVALASQQSAGSTMSYGEDDELVAGDAARFDYASVDLLISAMPADVALQLLPDIARAGCKVVDCSGAFRMDPDVPLCVAGVNDDVLAHARRNMVALPDAMACILSQALKPIHDMAHVTRVVVGTYQSASGAGRPAMDELFSQTRSVFVNDPIVKEQFPKQIAFNVIPQVGAFRNDGQTEDEFMLAAETKKIVDVKIKVSATCTRVPTFLGTALALAIECADEIDPNAVRTALRRNNALSVVDHRVDDGYVTPVEAAGEDAIYVSRIRDDVSVENGLHMWVVADTIRAGVAQNAVRTALAWLAGSAEVKRTATLH